MHQNPSKGLILRVPEKNKIKQSQKNVISSICQELPLEWIVTKFGTWGPPADLINCAKFFGNRFKGFDYVEGVKIAHPIDLRCRR